RRDRVLGRADPPPAGLGGSLAPNGGADLRAPRADALAAENPEDGRSLHRLPVRLGWRERAPLVAIRPPGARRLRLLRLCVAHLQAAALSGRAATRGRAPRPDDLCDERR